MKPIAWDWDFLIHRHLEGALAGEDRKALLEKLRIDARLRRRLAEMAFEGALYPALLGGSELRPPLPSQSLAAPLLKPAPGRRRRKPPGSSKP